MHGLLPAPESQECVAPSMARDSVDRDLSPSRLLAAGVRRTFDCTLALLIAAAAAPILIALVVAIRLDSRGPVVFRQRRVGRDGKPFTVRKFRSMVADADASRHQRYVVSLIEGSGERTGQYGLYKLTSDDRVTRVGHFIRKWSLDELPQLWNVIAGDMSLVGPRPVIEYEVARYPGWYFKRFEVKPGMTGLWQVSGRNERTYEEMVELDCEYVDRQSLLLDTSILIRTVWTVLRRKGAA
jgi:lipopolysaccharide/colanic/teichoic acid biosynthesis glycosyltransferase